MNGLVFEHNSIDNSQTCAYAFADQTTQVKEFGVLSEHNQNLSSVDEGAEVVREVLQKLVEVDGSNFQIYNTSQYQPQLEISRLPHEDRETVYEEKDYSIKSDAQGTFINTGKFLSTSAIEFVSTNYPRFDNPVTTTKAPKPAVDREEGLPTYYLYTDASYHPKNKTSGVSFVIIGENGGLYASGQKVEPQNITRAELLAFIMGVQTVQTISDECRILAHTDCKEVKTSIEHGIMIDQKLNETVQNLVTKEGFSVTVKNIDRNANTLTDSVAKVSRRHGRISAGKLQ